MVAQVVKACLVQCIKIGISKQVRQINKWKWTFCIRITARKRLVNFILLFLGVFAT